jgi:hypothetical protein
MGCTVAAKQFSGKDGGNTEKEDHHADRDARQEAQLEL